MGSGVITHGELGVSRQLVCGSIVMRMLRPGYGSAKQYEGCEK
jgi:hypothetical protein